MTFRSDGLYRLREIIKRSYKEGRFTLSSGKQSNYYLDCKLVILDSEGITLVADEMIRIIYDYRHAGAVAGVELGGALLATAVSLASNSAVGKSLPALIVRKGIKGHGTKKIIEGTENVPAGTEIAVLEDVITTGRSAWTAVARLREAGYLVMRVLAVIDRQEGGRETLADIGCDLRVLFRRDDFL